MSFPIGCYPKSQKPLSVPFVGPLDAFTTGRALILLPFRGFTDYVGACGRVRDAGDGDAEQDEAFDSAGEPVFPTLVGAGGWSWWYDQSGNGNDMPQSSATNQPTLTPSVVNGYQTVRFDGANDKMGLDVGAWTETTIYIVAKRISPTANGRLLEISTGITRSIFVDGSGVYQFYAGFPSAIVSVGGTADNWSIIVLKATDTSGFTPYVNGLAGTPVVFLGISDLTYINLCTSSAGEYGNFDVAAVMRYDVAHDDTTREAIQGILAAKFGITL